MARCCSILCRLWLGTGKTKRPRTRCGCVVPLGTAPDLLEQLTPGTLEHAIDYLVDAQWLLFCCVDSAEVAGQGRLRGPVFAIAGSIGRPTAINTLEKPRKGATIRIPTNSSPCSLSSPHQHPELPFPTCRTRRSRQVRKMPSSYVATP